MTTETKTIDQLTDEFANNMAAQGTALTEELKTLDADYKTKRAGLVAQIASVDRVVKALRAKATTQIGLPTGRKPMSAEGRANIAAALRARRDRLAAEAAGGKATEAAAVPDTATEEQSGVVETAAETVVEPVAEEAAAQGKKAAAKKGGKNAKG